MPAALSNLSNMFRVADLRNKVLFTLAVIGVYELGANIPCPGINYAAIHAATSGGANHAGALGFLNLFSGGGLARFAVFGLGIMPYITSSIIVQLLMVVIPKFEKWRDEGATGQKRLTQITRYMTIVLAVLQSVTLAYTFHYDPQALIGSSSSSLNFIPHFSLPLVLLIVLTMTAGTVVVMWLAELITQRGVGQGMSILIFANVVSTMPAGGAAIKDQAGWAKLGIVIVISIILLGCIVFVEQGQRRIPVTFAKRVVGRRMYGGQSTYIPMKVNTGGVVPIIFASSVLYFPILISQVLPTHGTGLAVQSWVNTHLAQPNNLVYIGIYGVLILGFAYFYAALTFDPHQQADIIRKQGGYIPGIRPGPPTERHLSMILNRITLPGAIWLGAIALLPALMLALFNIQNYPFAGTTLLIAVGVALQTLQQVDSQLMLRNYEGFLS
ncbi:MAG TPA: preprotein translocase subunit SecY [Acidimicrobiales bacterium]|nr:preprotein translocase subunit SecY [Acidimicrobiales bacterium]